MKLIKASVIAATTIVPASAFASITVMPLGDSITAGYDGSPSAGYRQDLLNDLTAANTQIQYQGVYDPTPAAGLGYSPALTAIGQNMITAFGGFTSSDILANLNGDVPSPGLPTTYPFTDNKGGYWLTGGNGTGRGALDPSIVLLMVGTNDAITNYGVDITPAETDSNLTSIFGWFACNRPGTVLLVASPPPDVANQESFGPAVFNAVTLENSWLDANAPLYSNVQFVDVYDSFLNTNGSVNTSLFSADGIHPDVAGYSVIANDYNAAIQQLRSSSRVFNNSTGTATFQTDTCIGGSKLFVNAFGGAVVFGATQHLAGLNVSCGALVQVSPTVPGNRTVVITPTLVVNGALDLTDNDLDVQGGNLATVESLVHDGYNGGKWNGSGISSSAAANDSTNLTALGVVLNDNGHAQPLYGSGAPLGLFDGVSPALGDVLVKYTYYGDANLDGYVDGSDYSRIDNGYLQGLTGWANGDFNYDGVIDGSDYTLIDNAYNTQGASLAAETVSSAGLTSEIAVASAVPEPTGDFSILIAAIGLLSRRAKRSSHRADRLAV